MHICPFLLTIISLPYLVSFLSASLQTAVSSHQSEALRANTEGKTQALYIKELCAFQTRTQAETAIIILLDALSLQTYKADLMQLLYLIVLTQESEEGSSCSQMPSFGNHPPSLHWGKPSILWCRYIRCGAVGLHTQMRHSLSANNTLFWVKWRTHFFEPWLSTWLLQTVSCHKLKTGNKRWPTTPLNTPSNLQVHDSNSFFVLYHPTEWMSWELLGQSLIIS